MSESTGAAQRSSKRVCSRNWPRCANAALPPICGHLTLDSFQLTAQLRIRPRPVEQPAQEAADVEPCAAADNRASAAGLDINQRIARTVTPGCGIERLVRLGHVDHVVTDLRQQRRLGLGCADVHVPINLTRVGADNLGIEPPRNLR